MTRRTLTRLVALLALGACGRAASDTAFASRVDSLAAAYRHRTYVPGLSLSVVRAGRDTLALRGYGTADLENGVPATPATVYPIGSVTKQLTAAAVMRLVEEKRLGLDDPLGRYLPGLPAAWSSIRIRQLLNHTAGLARDAARTPEEPEMDPVIARAAREPLEFAPGTRFQYSNLGYMILGRVVERVTGESWAGYLESKILRPAGLREIRSCDPEAIIPHRAAGYELHDTTTVNAPLGNVHLGFSAGSLCSTAGGLTTWSRALATGRVVTPASWARMTTPEGAATVADGAPYGYGLIVASLDGHRLLAHAGAVSGFRSSVLYLPDDSLSVVVLTNAYRTSESPELLALGIARAALARGR